MSGKSEKWPRARLGFLQGAGLTMLMAAVIGIGGLADGTPAAVTLALGGLGLAVAGALLVVDRMYPGLDPPERRTLVLSVLFSLVVYVGGLLIDSASPAGGQAYLALAGIPATLTAAYAIALAIRHRA